MSRLIPCPQVSIFIVNYNTRDLLIKCLESIFDTKGDIVVDIFVADNNSNDGSPEMVKARFPQIFLSRYSENMGFTRAINPLLPVAKGKYYLLLHPDVEILPNTLMRLVEFLECEPQAGIAGANLYYADGTPNPCEVLWPGFKNDLLCFAVRLFHRLPGAKKLIGSYDPREWSHEATCQVTSVWNACMMVRREVFEAIGYFDENFFYASADWDLCKRANEAGWGVYYIHPATAIHHERQSFAKEEVIRDEVKYKVDGWHSSAWQYKDRYVFLKKHCSPASVYGVKTIYVVENLFRLWLILVNLLILRNSFRKASWQLRACLETIHTILKA